MFSIVGQLEWTQHQYWFFFISKILIDHLNFGA